LKKFIMRSFASFFGLGYLPAAPGTWGSIGAFLVWLLFLRDLSPKAYLVIVILFTFFAIYVADFANKKCYKKKDSPHIVIDEVVGYFISMIFVSSSIYWGIAGLVLFRFFDILKPYPVNKAEGLPGGLGVMADDILAGLYVAMILNATAYFLL
jgi:phosphatidylglycerophosphatase A